MSIPIRRTANPLFGKPVLVAANSGTVAWTKNTSLSQFQKGTGWQAELYGGAQSGDDWAACYIPVDEIFVTDFHSALWSWYQTAAETMGLGMVIWIHDPYDLDKRAEVTQLANIAGLSKAAGWNAHAWNTATTQMFFYGEGTTGTGLTAGTQYPWTSFQSDTLFHKWTIYRISFDWGWEASGTFEAVYLADVKLNGVTVAIRPDETEIDQATGAYTTATHTAVTVGTTTTAVLAANANRLYALVINDSNEVIYIKIGASAVLNQGVRLNASGGNYEMSKKLGNLNTGAINGICVSGSKVALVLEGV